MYVCLYVCMYVCMYTQTHTHHAETCMYQYIYIYIHTYIYIDVRISPLSRSAVYVVHVDRSNAPNTLLLKGIRRGRCQTRINVLGFMVGWGAMGLGVWGDTLHNSYILGCFFEHSRILACFRAGNVRVLFVRLRTRNTARMANPLEKLAKH